jgi:hypothetical protein
LQTALLHAAAALIASHLRPQVALLTFEASGAEGMAGAMGDLGLGLGEGEWGGEQDLLDLMDGALGGQG